MRHLIFILSFLFSTTSFGQNSLDKIVSSEICGCISKMKGLTEDSLSNCFEKAMLNNSDLIIKECLATYKDTSEQTGFKFGQEFYGRISVSMIYSCKQYYNYMDNLRYTGFYGLNKDSVKNAIQSMSMSDPKTWDKDFYTKRGVMYFQITMLDKAMDDFNNAINLDKNSLQSLFFKAWTFEEQKNYDQAYSLYSNLALMTKRNDFNIFAAIVNQKKNGL